MSLSFFSELTSLLILILDEQIVITPGTKFTDLLGMVIRKMFHHVNPVRCLEGTT
jgi:hypothetical protein